MGKYIHAGTGISSADDPAQAGKEAVEMALEKLKEDGGKKPDFALVFCSGGKYGRNDKTIKQFVDAVHEALTSANKDVKWIGCTTAGEISNYGLTENSAVVLVVESEYVQVGVGVGEDVLNDPKKAGATAVKQALETLKPDKYVTPYVKYLAQKKKKPIESIKYYDYWVIALSRGLTLGSPGKEDEVAEGIYSVVGKRIPVIGGTAGDDMYLKNNYVLSNGNFYSAAVVCMAITSGLKVGFSFSHGYEETDEITVVTDAEGNVVKELDHKPAGIRYAELLGMKFEELYDVKSKLINASTPVVKIFQRAFNIKLDPKVSKFLINALTNPLALKDIYNNLYIRIPKKISKNSLEFNQKIPKYSVLVKLKIDQNKLYSAENEAIKDAISDSSGNNPKIFLIFDCTLRKYYIGTEKMREIIENLKIQSPNSVIIGLNTMGEFVFKRDSDPTSNAASVSIGVIHDELITD